MKNKKPQACFAHACGFSVILLAINDLFGEIENKIAEIQHEQQCRKEKQPHKKVKYAVALAARVLNIVHQLCKLL